MEVFKTNLDGKMEENEKKLLESTNDGTEEKGKFIYANWYTKIIQYIVKYIFLKNNYYILSDFVINILDDNELSVLMAQYKILLGLFVNNHPILDKIIQKRINIDTAYFKHKKMLKSLLGDSKINFCLIFKT